MEIYAYPRFATPTFITWLALPRSIRRRMRARQRASMRGAPIGSDRAVSISTPFFSHGFH